MNDTVNNFLSTLIPNNLPKKKRELLYSELECHLYDKADFYKQIGYSEDESIKKAIDDMGTDEEINDGIVREFEELYHERSWWAVIPACIILLMNIICWFSGNWVTSVDSNDDPTSLKAFISFFMIFASIGITAFARIKNYRKCLVGAGIGNLILGVLYLFCFYPQSAMYALVYNTVLLIDKLTPFAVTELLGKSYMAFFVFSVLFTLLSAIYCFVASARIKYGKAKDIENVKTKCIVFSSCFAAVAVISCCLLPKAVSFDRDYPVWFDFHIYISDESQELYDSIELGMLYSEADSFLKSRGWISTEEYEKQLNKNTLKKFRYELDSLEFDSDYAVWFNPEKHIDGNGFVFLKQDRDGKVTSKGIGNAGPFNSGEYGGFRLSSYRTDDMKAVISDFEKLKKDDSEETVMSNFGKSNFDEKQGIIYTRFESTQNGKKIDYFRVYAHGSVYSTDNLYENPTESRYIEFEFIDGKLTKGEMKWEEYGGKKNILCKKMIKDS